MLESLGIERAEAGGGDGDFLDGSSMFDSLFTSIGGLDFVLKEKERCVIEASIADMETDFQGGSALRRVAGPVIVLGKGFASKVGEMTAMEGR